MFVIPHRRGPRHDAQVGGATEESLSDYPAFVGTLKMDMIAGLIAAENAEILHGTGTTPSTYQGLLVVPGTGSYTQAGTDTVLDAVEQGATVLRAGGRFCEATALVMNPLQYSIAPARQVDPGRVHRLGSDPVRAVDPVGPAGRPEQ